MRIRAALTTVALAVAVPTVVACSGGSTTAHQVQSTSGAGGSTTASITTMIDRAAATAGATGTTSAAAVTGSGIAAGRSTAATAGTTAAAAASGGIAISCSALNAALPAATIAAAVGGTPSAGDPDLGGCQWFLSGPRQDGMLEIHSTTAASKTEWLEIQTGDPDPTDPAVEVPDIGGHTAYWDPKGSIFGGQLTVWDGVKEVDLGIVHRGSTNAAQLASDRASLTTLAIDLTKK